MHTDGVNCFPELQYVSAQRRAGAGAAAAGAAGMMGASAGMANLLNPMGPGRPFVPGKWE